MSNELLAKLLDPVIEGEKYFETWKISQVEFPNLDQPRVVIRIENDSENSVKLVMSPGVAGAPCYDRTPSFNLAFSSDKEGPLDKNAEEALIYVIEAIRLNDNGRFSIEYDENHIPVLNEAPPKPTLMSKVRDVFFPPRKKDDKTVQDQSSPDKSSPVLPDPGRTSPDTPSEPGVQA
jgi:hypothetical protein